MQAVLRRRTGPGFVDSDFANLAASRPSVSRPGRPPELRLSVVFHYNDGRAASRPATSMNPSEPDEDPTLPSAKASGAGDGDAGEERTVPSGKKAPPPPADERTAPALEAKQFASGNDPGQLLGKVLGGCRIDKMLGRGAMGAVYKARQLKLDRDVAVKVIRPEMMTDPRMLKRFEVEARTVGKFNSAHVVMVHDVGFELGVHFLVMEFVQGKNLREHVKLLAGGRLQAGDALPLIRQAVKGLDEARRLGVVHRDIKPDNLMLTDQGVLKIADFGIAKPIQDDFHMTMTSELIGTPLYMSPEQCQGGADVDFRSDMYSLGATFFYLLTGEPPIRASSVYELIQTKTKLENLCLWKQLPELDENHPLSRLIERMTANDREDRYGSYDELLNDLVLVEAGETLHTPPKRIKKAAAAKPVAAKGGRGLLMALGAVVVLGAAVGGYFSFVHRPETPEPGPRPESGGAPVGGSGVGATADVAATRAALARFRTRLENNGPGGTLRDEVRDLAVPAELATDRDRLLADVEAGLAVEARPADVERPAGLVLRVEADGTEWVQRACRSEANAKNWAVRNPLPAGTSERQRVVGGGTSCCCRSRSSSATSATSRPRRR